MSAITWLIKRLIDPVAILWLGLLFLAGLYCRHKYYRTAGLLGSIALGLTLCGGTTLPFSLSATLEASYYSSTDMDSIPRVSTVLVLGGYISHGQGEIHGFDTGDAFDRILTGVELVRLGKGQLLLLGGGAVVNGTMKDTEFSEIEPWISRWELVGVPVDHVGLQSNTFEEAKAVKQFLDARQEDRVILVTSALHMKRAKAVFESAGIKVEAVACDYLSIPKVDTPVIPSSDRLRILKRYLHEKVGWYHYRMRGWITE